jgi:hypothetical protein
MVACHFADDLDLKTISVRQPIGSEEKQEEVVS